MKVLVCGGRRFKDRALLDRTLDALDAEIPITRVIEGGAWGADRLACMWALAHERESQRFPAQWAKHGKAAGPIRNAKMLAEAQPDLVVAFAGGNGTADMVFRAKTSGVRVVEVRDDGTRIDTAPRISVVRMAGF